MSKDKIIERLLKTGVVAIIRADNSEQLIDATQSLIEGGVDCIEVTMTTPNALQVIRDATQKFGDKLLMGVGSITDAATVQLAVDAGAEYVVTPVTKIEVIKACGKLGKPIASGAYTPTEAQTAYEAGADFIKIFPADGLGPNYIKAMLAPLPHLKIIPTGGVDVSTCGAFIKAGCVAVAAGSSLVSKDILKNRDWKKLGESAAALVAAVKAARA